LVNVRPSVTSKIATRNKSTFLNIKTV